jgi:hypothetical protein
VNKTTRIIALVIVIAMVVALLASLVMPYLL